ncbi:MAG: hypothetical protein OEW88_07360 [Gammaproteobacteria bacterium]|nr:hypothetical protein [Gammaproteobacteria bacterium]MDH5276225.1 hypothetical protein [Gammaproteobacteria bacterium]
MAIKNVRSLMRDEFSKFAQETLGVLRERAGELETNMTKVMVESGKEFGMDLGEGMKLGSIWEKNPRRAAAIGLMGGVMLSRVMQSRDVTPVVDPNPAKASPGTKKRGKPARSRKASKRKTTEVAEAA